MNKFIRLTLKVVVATALVGSAVGCSNFPLGGRNQGANQANQANQVEPVPEATSNQPAGQVPIQRTNQPNQTTTQAPQATGTQGDTVVTQVPQTTGTQGGTGTTQAPQTTGTQGTTGTTGTTEPLEADANQPVEALW